MINYYLSIKIFSFLLSSSIYAYPYDNELLHLYTNERPSFDLLDRNIRNTSNNVESDIKLLERLYRNPDVPIARNMSHKSIQSRDVISHFFVYELNSDYEPFTNLFADYDLSPLASNYSLPSWMQFINASGCEVIDFFDVKMNVDHLSTFQNFKSLRVLGLPNRGMVFDREFVLPENLETLIVRNTTLNEYFFDAIRKLPKLNRIIILKSSLSLQSPKKIGFGYDKSSWIDLPRIFEELCKKLIYVKIKESDPDLFNYMLAENWPQLMKMEIDFTSYNKNALTYLIEEKRDNDNIVFPALSQLTVRSLLHDNEILNRAFPFHHIEN